MAESARVRDGEGNVDCVQSLLNRDNNAFEMQPGQTIEAQVRPEEQRRQRLYKEQSFDESERTWITQHVKRRECITFIEDKQEAFTSEESSQKKCKCGHLQEHHPQKKPPLSAEEKWDHTKHAVAKKPTDGFGEIEFVGHGEQLAKYIRVDCETDMETLVTLMIDKWHMTKPKLLISVTGGAKDFRLKNRLKEACRRGLRSAAQIPGAWLVTGGTHAGVMKHVGKAVRDLGLTEEGSALTAIGIAPWGCVQKRELLTNKDGMWPARYEVQAEEDPNESFLDPNHTHFILVDNGTQHKFATEIKLRTDLESRIAQMPASDTVGERVKVPVVLLVLEGGPGTLKTAVHTIRKGTPTIVIKGSGRCADVLAYASQHSTPKENGSTSTVIENEVDAKVEEEIERLVRETMAPRRHSEVKDLVEMVKECVRYPHLLSVYELDARSKSSSDVDVAILKALLRAMKNNVMVQLELALSWNRVDVAKSEVFTDERTWTTEQLADVMMVAIKQDKTSFVELFLDNGFSLRDFLTIERLRQLYDEVPPNCLLHKLLNRYKSSKCAEFPMRHVGRLLQSLMGSFYEPHQLLMKKELYRDPASPAQELFLWSVLMNQQEMAKLFWREGNESTAAALAANGLLKAMALETHDTDVLKALEKNAAEFEKLAIGVLNTCYNKHEQKAMDVLVRELPRWGNTSCVLIALKSDNRCFISQTACQSLLTSVWMGKMSKDNSIWKLLLCMIFPPLIFFIINFRDDPKLLSKSVDKSLNKSPSQKSFTLNGQISQQEDKSGCCSPSAMLCSLWRKLRRFYRAPVIVFILNCISYVVFLGLYSYVLLVQLTPTFHPATEILVVIWVVSIFTEGLRQFISYKFKKSTWKFFLDVTTILMFGVGAALRAIPRAKCRDCFGWGRVFLALNLVPLFFRILYVFSISKELGPKVVMIRRMMKDLFWFVLILLVFVTSYAIASEAILYPNTELSWKLLYRLPRKAYWHIYGELFLEEIEGESCEEDVELRCPTNIGQYLVPIFMGVYILMTNVLLLNLLIAMFSYTFQKIHENTDIYWHFQKFGLIFEYSARPCLPPPFIVLGHLYMLLRWAGAKLGWWSKKSRTSYFKRKLKSKQLIRWEDIMTEKYLTKEEAELAEKVDGRVKVVMQRLEAVQNRVDDMMELQTSLRDVTQPAAQQPATVTTVSAPPTSDLLKQVIKQQQRLEDRLVGMEDRILARIMKTVEGKKDTRHPYREPTEEDTSL